MTGHKRVFVDTAPLIYFLDNDENFGEKTKRILEELLNDNGLLISSAITCVEYLVYPYRTNNQEKADAFFEFAENERMLLTPISTSIAKTAAKIRSKYEHFKAMDAIQLAVAIETNCDVFLTNDNQLKQFDGIKVMTIEEW